MQASQMYSGVAHGPHGFQNRRFGQLMLLHIPIPPPPSAGKVNYAQHLQITSGVYFVISECMSPPSMRLAKVLTVPLAPVRQGSPYRLALCKFHFIPLPSSPLQK